MRLGDARQVRVLQGSPRRLLHRLRHPGHIREVGRLRRLLLPSSRSSPMLLGASGCLRCTAACPQAVSLQIEYPNVLHHESQEWQHMLAWRHPVSSTAARVVSGRAQ